MSKFVRKLLSLLTTFVMLLPSLLGTSVAFAQNDKNADEVASEVEKLNKEGKLTGTQQKFLDETHQEISSKSFEEYLDDTSEEALATERVIVKVDGSSGLDQANQSGVAYQSLPEDKKVSFEADALAIQNDVVSSAQANGIQLETLSHFTVVLNGFSANVPAGQVKRLEAIPGVVSVEPVNEYERPEPISPEMVTSVRQIQAPETWENYQEDGAGTVIAILDSGLDYRHQDFVLDQGVEQKLNAQSLNGLDLPGKFFTEKVPYGYNYFDKSDQIIEVGPKISHHGTHVAGSAAANGDLDNGGVKGTAPNAQLLGLKVFSNDPVHGTTFSDVYIKAFDDAAKLGADVLNLSLGAPAGNVNEASYEAEAITKMRENGMIVSISAGNSSHFAEGTQKAGITNSNPLTLNPDVGTVGSPSVHGDTLSVASSQNNFTTNDIFVWGQENNEVIYAVGMNDPVEAFDGPVGFVDVGFGSPEEYEGKDVEGKIVLASRGMSETGNADFAAFTNKGIQATQAKAAGIIVYDNRPGPLVNMAGDPGIKVPYLFISQEDGQEILAALEDNPDLTAEFTGEKQTKVSESAGKISDFSSIGLAPTLDFKPEITAPGGNILSTVQDGKYGLMSGTSMAAPTAAGGAALVLSQIDDRTDLTGSDRALFAKLLMMNTAKPLVDLGPGNTENLSTTNYYTPRLQGAGELQLHAALSTPVTVSSPNDGGQGKVALKEIGDKVSFDLVVTNHSDKREVYTANTVVQSDLSTAGKSLGVAEDVLEAAALKDVDVSYSDQVVIVEPNSSTTLTVNLDLTNAKLQYVTESGEEAFGNPKELFPNGYFVDAFVELTHVLDNHPKLSVPVSGFNGDWSALPIIDPESSADNSYYGVTSVYFNKNRKIYRLNERYIPAFGEDVILHNGVDVENHWLLGRIESPLQLFPIVALLRNADLEVNILDSEGNEVKTLTKREGVRKNYFWSGRGPLFTALQDGIWDYTAEGNPVPDGKYTIEVAADSQDSGEEWQTWHYTYHIDRTAPELDLNRVSDTKVEVKASDNYSGILGIDIFFDGELAESREARPNEKVFEETIDVPEDVDKVTIAAFDFAGNFTEEGTNTGEVFAHDEIRLFIEQPEILGNFNTNEVPVKGYVESNVEIEKVVVHGVDFDVKHDKNKGTYHFEGTLTLEDGGYDIGIVAVAVNGEEFKLNRQILVDTAAPVIEFKTPEVTNDPELSVDFKVKDNVYAISLYINEDLVHRVPLESPIEPRDFETEYTHVFELKEGENVYQVKAVDAVGNETIKELKVVYDPDFKEPVVEIYEETIQENVVPFETVTTETDELPLGEEEVVTEGQEGYDNVTYKVTTKDGEEVKREEISRETVAPVNREVLVGTFVEPTPEPEPAPVEPTTELPNRIAGANRYEVSAAISQHTFESSDRVIIANGEVFTDALTVSPLAAQLEAPVLLTRPGRLDASVIQEIRRLGATEVVILGGHVSVTPEVEAALAHVGNVQKVRRISGANRYEVAVNIANELSNFVTSDTAFLVYGEAFPDGISVAPFAASLNAPIYLTRNDGSDKELVNTLERYKNVYIIGGHKSVAAHTEQALANRGVQNVKRLAGANRYEANQSVLNEFVTDADLLFVATGEVFTDALTGALLASQHDTGILLTRQRLTDEFVGYVNNRQFDDFVIFGGPKSVPLEIEAFLTESIQ